MKTYYKPEQITIEARLLEFENIYFIRQVQHNLISLPLLHYTNLIKILNMTCYDFNRYRVFNMSDLLRLKKKTKYLK